MSRVCVSDWCERKRKGVEFHTKGVKLDATWRVGGTPVINWGEPERAPHKRYSHAQILYYILYMVRPSREIIYPVISTDINAKHSIAHSHAWDTGRIYVVLI